MNIYSSINKFAGFFVTTFFEETGMPIRYRDLADKDKKT